MKLKSKLNRAIHRDIDTGEIVVSFNIPKDSEQEFLHFCEDLGHVDLEISLNRWKLNKAKSLNANSYCWVLLTELAKKHGSSKEEEYEIALQKYGSFDLINGALQRFSFDRMNADSIVKQLKAKGFHLCPLSATYDRVDYALLKGLSEYTSTEMHCLLDGIIADCKLENIETLTPQELQHLYSLNK